MLKLVCPVKAPSSGPLCAVLARTRRVSRKGGKIVIFIDIFFYKGSLTF